MLPDESKTKHMWTCLAHSARGGGAEPGGYGDGGGERVGGGGDGDGGGGLKYGGGGGGGEGAGGTATGVVLPQMMKPPYVIE